MTRRSAHPATATDRRPRRRRAIAVAAATAGALLVTTPGAAAGAPCPDADALPATVGQDRAVAAVGCLVDDLRTTAGLAPLLPDARLRTAAQRYAEDMAARHFFSHEDPEGRNPGTRLIAAGYLWSAYGENVAAGQRTPTEVMESWLTSPSHCHALMTPGYTQAGYGVAPAADGPYWVQEFARPVVALTPGPGTPLPCPRAAAPIAGTTAPAPSPAGDAPLATAPAAAPRPRLRARRSGRTLRLVVVLPASARDGATMTVRVRQAGGATRTRTMSARRAGPATRRVTVRLRTARSGRVAVRAGGGPWATARFS